MPCRAATPTKWQRSLFATPSHVQTPLFSKCFSLTGQIDGPRSQASLHQSQEPLILPYLGLRRCVVHRLLNWHWPAPARRPLIKLVDNAI